MQELDFAALKRSSISLFNDEKQETAISRWRKMAFYFNLSFEINDKTIEFMRKTIEKELWKWISCDTNLKRRRGQVHHFNRIFI
ncbi:hypothetical protein V2J09_010093 [Rumex salicifolius]